MIFLSVDQDTKKYHIATKESGLNSQGIQLVLRAAIRLYHIYIVYIQGKQFQVRRLDSLNFQNG